MGVADRKVQFWLNDMLFEYDAEKGRQNIKKHGISFETAAYVFLDSHRIEWGDNRHSWDEKRYDVLGEISYEGVPVIGNMRGRSGDEEDVVFIVYTDRKAVYRDGGIVEVTRLISARYATDFERGVYYGNYRRFQD